MRGSLEGALSVWSFLTVRTATHLGLLRITKANESEGQSEKESDFPPWSCVAEQIDKQFAPCADVLLMAILTPNASETSSLGKTPVTIGPGTSAKNLRPIDLSTILLPSK